MTNDLATPLHGKISSVSRCGRFGVVTLDEPVSGHKFAVINGETKGRIALMSAAEDGRLQKNTAVTIIEAERGSEAFRALQVAAA
ncbi:MAG: hypothetical protein P4L81_05430 [Candidatus Pacebacteria bacterium]|nr:hypothetical protein [Candidatus Paceibacterota bacterium]